MGHELKKTRCSVDTKLKKTAGESAEVAATATTWNLVD